MTLRSAYRCGHDGRPGWCFSAGSDAELVAALGRWFPAADRAWDAERGQSWVAERWEGELVRLIPALAAHTQQASLF